MKRTKPIPKTNPKRKASEFARCYGSKERVLFVKALPCVACDRAPCENHHIRNGGAGRKADYDKIIPLCTSHHDRWHEKGARSFVATYGLDLGKLATATESKWQSFLSGDEMEEGA